MAARVCSAPQGNGMYPGSPGDRQVNGASTPGGNGCWTHSTPLVLMQMGISTVPFVPDAARLKHSPPLGRGVTVEVGGAGGQLRLPSACWTQPGPCTTNAVGPAEGSEPGGQSILPSGSN